VRWTLVVPIKPLSTAKSRLRGAVPGASHDRLVLAMAEDTVAAALACELVVAALVVADDAPVRAALAELGAHGVPDAPAAGLNAALAYGAQLAGRVPVAALTADLPALRAEELAAALRAAARLGRRSYVPDAFGTGTVLLASPTGEPLAPSFGPYSAAAHERGGARRLHGDRPTLRRDVDTAADLAAAAALGLGARTAALVAGALR
jgi:2-phospho-L-lactate guanylyltransferase